MAEAKSAANAPVETPDDDLGEPDIKVILLGDSAVGKSKLVERFMMNEFQPRQVGELYIEVLHCMNAAVLTQLVRYCSYQRLH
jgi:DNA replicative helicase MCM subunit Mcm2 (Cdc46/Mcm family)